MRAPVAVATVLFAASALLRAGEPAEGATLLSLPLNGTIEGAPCKGEDLRWSDEGVAGKCLDCDGKQKLKATLNATSLSGGVTVSAWVRLPASALEGERMRFAAVQGVWECSFQPNAQTKKFALCSSVTTDPATVHGEVPRYANKLDTPAFIPADTWVYVVAAYSQDSPESGSLTLVIHGTPNAPTGRFIEHAPVIGAWKPDDTLHLASAPGKRGLIGRIDELHVNAGQRRLDAAAQVWLAATKAGTATGARPEVLLATDRDASGDKAFLPMAAQTVTTFNSLGIYLTYGGDNNENSTCRVRYREAGGAWRQGMDLFASRIDREFRGSLLRLKTGTQYEIECQPADPDASAPIAPVILKATTWAESATVGETIALPERSDQPLVISKQGKPDAWIRYAPEPGKSATIDVGDRAPQAVRIANSAYVILELATVRGGTKSGVHIEDSHHIRVVGCDISGFSEWGTIKDGVHIDAQGKDINIQPGIMIGRESSQVVVESNFIHSPVGSANSWEFGHPKGPEAVVIAYSNGNHVIRNNDFIGSEGHWWNDDIECVPNSAVCGGPHHDTDICGNILAFANDDGTEMDGGQLNVRFYNNWIEHCLCGISVAPCRKGPDYVFNNVFVPGDERRKSNAGFKIGAGAFPHPGMLVLCNNTFCTPMYGLATGQYGGSGPSVFLMRNNIFAPQGQKGGSFGKLFGTPGEDMDYDQFPPFAGTALAAGREAHGTPALPKFVDEAARDFRLRDGSPGKGAGCALAGLTDDGPVDTGAHPAGAKQLFPVRSDGLSALPHRSVLRVKPGEPPAPVNVELRVPASAGSKWTAIPNSPWIACKPISGSAGNEPQTVSVSFVGEKQEKPLYRGAVTFRTDKGLNRTVMIDARVLHKPFLALFEGEAGKLDRGFKRIEKAEASGGAYLGTEEGDTSGSAVFEFEAPEDGMYYVFGRVFVPVVQSARHDSFEISVDGQLKITWDLESRPGEFVWTDVTPRKGTAEFALKKGVHKIVVYPRESLAGLDQLAVTRSPAWEDLEEALAEKR